MATVRRDYAFPFSIDASARQAAQAPYDEHVEQMIRQVLLTALGERTDLPNFGCGLRALIFAPNSSGLTTTVQLLVKDALSRWLAGVITVQSIEVLPPESTPDENQLLILIQYSLLATGGTASLEVQVI